MIVIDEDGEEDSIDITGGHSYSLQCDPNAPFVLHEGGRGQVLT